MRRFERRRSCGLRVVLAAVAIAIAGPGAAQQDPAPSEFRTEPAPTAPAAEPATEPTPAPAAPAAAAPKPAARQVATAAAAAAEIPKPSERAWVRGEVKVNYRASASPNSTPLGVLTTGDDVGVIERKNGWARVLVGESSVGWLQESYLDAEPPPREHVAMLEAQVAELQQNLDEAEREAGTLRAQVAEMSGREAEREEEMRRLRDENRDLQAGERWPYMVMGAAIFAAGIVATLILRPGSRRSSARLRY
jgi:hypothetical protein